MNTLVIAFVALFFAVALAVCRGHWAEAGIFALVAFHLGFMIFVMVKAETDNAE